MTKAKTIDEHYGKPEGTYKKFIQKSEGQVVKEEEERKARIRARKK